MIDPMLERHGRVSPRRGGQRRPPARASAAARSGDSGLPGAVLAKPHWGLSASRSRGTSRAAASIRRRRSSGVLEHGRLGRHQAEDDRAARRDVAKRLEPSGPRRVVLEEEGVDGEPGEGAGGHVVVGPLPEPLALVVAPADVDADGQPGRAARERRVHQRDVAVEHARRDRSPSPRTPRDAEGRTGVRAARRRAGRRWRRAPPGRRARPGRSRPRRRRTRRGPGTRGRRRPGASGGSAGTRDSAA